MSEVLIGIIGLGALLLLFLTGIELGFAMAATFAAVAVPEMDRYGYDKRLSTGVVASVGTVAVIILAAAQRGMGLRGFVKAVSESLRTACMVLMLIAGSTILGHFLAVVKLGFDPLWFGMIIAITVMIGVVIPPVAMNVFVVKNITKVPFGVIYRGVAPFLASLVVCGALLYLVPQIATFLPNLLMK